MSNMSGFKTCLTILNCCNKKEIKLKMARLRHLREGVKFGGCVSSNGSLIIIHKHFVPGPTLQYILSKGLWRKMSLECIMLDRGA